MSTLKTPFLLSCYDAQKNMSQTSVLTPMVMTRTRLKDSWRDQGSYQEHRPGGDNSATSTDGHLSLSPCPHQQSTPVFIYRNAHYVGFFHRVTQYLLTYNRVYVLQPLNTHFWQARVYFLEFLGFLLLLFLAPILTIVASVLYIATKLKILLVSRRVPEALISEKMYSRSILKNGSHEMVNCIVWLNGRVDLENLRTRFAASNIPILKRKLASKYGLQVWEPYPTFNIRDQVVEAPSKYQNRSINDQNGVHGQKSVLQKYITHCVSMPMDGASRAPWEIVIIPLPSAATKDRTCCLLRFHGNLLKDPEVRKLLDDIFSEPGNSHLKDKKVRDLGKRYDSFLQTQDLDEPLRIIQQFGQSIVRTFATWYNVNLWKSQEDVESWCRLRWKQWQFHPKKTLLKAAGIEAMNRTHKIYRTLTHLNEAQLFHDAKVVLRVVMLMIRALSFIPVQVMGCFLDRSWSGFQKAEKSGTRSVAWSSSIPDSLLEAIRERLGKAASVESLLLTATSMALREYYLENGIRNPKTLTTCIPVPTSNLNFLKSTGFKVLQLPTEELQYRQQAKKLGRNLDQYPLWQLLGSYLLVQYLPYFVPRCLASILLDRLVQSHPITFTYLNADSTPLSSILPTMSLWGHPVEDFTVWTSSPSDFSVSITAVKYVDSVRLSVVSPMKSVDLLLTKRCGHYLNRLAEAVGVDKSRIPYSRKSSPTSSSCTSPSTLISNEAKLVNLAVEMQD